GLSCQAATKSWLISIATHIRVCGLKKCVTCMVPRYVPAIISTLGPFTWSRMIRSSCAAVSLFQSLMMPKACACLLNVCCSFLGSMVNATATMLPLPWRTGHTDTHALHTDTPSRQCNICVRLWLVSCGYSNALAVGHTTIRHPLATFIAWHILLQSH